MVEELQRYSLSFFLKDPAIAGFSYYSRSLITTPEGAKQGRKTRKIEGGNLSRWLPIQGPRVSVSGQAPKSYRTFVSLIGMGKLYQEHSGTLVPLDAHAPILNGRGTSQAPEYEIMLIQDTLFPLRYTCMEELQNKQLSAINLPITLPSSTSIPLLSLFHRWMPKLLPLMLSTLAFTHFSPFLSLGETKSPPILFQSTG